MNRFKFLILLFSLSSILSYSQVNFNYGPKIGVSIPTTEKEFLFSSFFEGNLYHRMDRYEPSPIIGFEVEGIAKKHFYFSLGLHYQRVSRKTEILRHDFYFWTVSQIVTQRFQGIYLPFKLGVQLGNENIDYNFYAGLRPSYYVSGLNRVASFSYEDGKGFTNNTVEGNPLNRIEYDLQELNKFQYQFVGGLGFTIHDKWKIDFSYNWGKVLYYARYNSFYAGSGLEEFHAIRTELNNIDLNVSLTYFLNKKSR